MDVAQSQAARVPRPPPLPPPPETARADLIMDGHSRSCFFPPHIYFVYWPTAPPMPKGSVDGGPPAPA
jgi:hypothetical protein